MASPPDDRSQGPSRPSGGRFAHFLDTTTKQVTAIAGLVAAIAALVVALRPSGNDANTTQFTQQAERTPTTQVSTTASTTTGGFQAFTLGQPKLTVRASPSNGAAATGQLQFHATVWIVCTEAGDSVTGAASVTSTTWDKVRTGPSDAPVGFVPDAWVDTGTSGPTEPSC